MSPRDLANLRDAISDGMRDPAFRREWSRYQTENAWANREYARLSPTIDRRYGAV